MEERFPIYLQGDDDALWHDARQGVVRGALAEAVPAAAERGTVLLVPGEDVLTLATHLPPVRQAERRRQAARYALEDRLAGPVEDLHFALGDRGEDDTRLAVVDRGCMRDWLDSLREAGLDTVAVTPDYLCLPSPDPGTWTVALFAGRALVRCERQSGFAAESDLLPSLLAAESGDPPALRVITVDNADNRHLLERLHEHGYDFETDFVGDADEIHDRLLRNAAARPGLDLRQGSFGRTSKLHVWWQPLRATAALLVGWVVLALAAQGLTYWQLQREVSQLRAQSEAAFRDAFPEVQRIRDLRLQAEEKLRALRGDGSASTLFGLLQATAEAAGDDDGLRIESLQYRDGSLYLSLAGENVQALERLRAGFNRQARARLTVESADAGSEGVQIRARVDRATDA